jgi:hypothetical protein
MKTFRRSYQEAPFADRVREFVEEPSTIDGERAKLMIWRIIFMPRFSPRISPVCPEAARLTRRCFFQTVLHTSNAA